MRTWGQVSQVPSQVQELQLQPGDGAGWLQADAVGLSWEAGSREVRHCLKQ